MSITKSIGSLITGSVNFLVTDPRNFLRNLILRLGHSGLKRAMPSFLLRGAEKMTRLEDLNVPDRAAEAAKLLNIKPAPPIQKTSRLDGPLRVAFLLNNSLPYTRSGYTVRTQQVLSNLRKLSTDTFVYTRLGYPSVVGKVSAKRAVVVNGVEYLKLMPHRIPFNFVARLAKEISLLEKECLKNSVQVLHTTTGFRNAVVVSHVASRIGVPWIYEVRGEPYNTWLSKMPEELRAVARKSKRYNDLVALETKAMRAASAVICLSEVSKARIVQQGVEKSKVFVFPNCMSEDAINFRGEQPPLDSLFKSEKCPTALVGSVTSIVDYEGLDVLLGAAEYLDPSIHFLIVGSGHSEESLKHQVKAAGMGRRFHFVGRKPEEEIFKWYKLLDVFVVPRKDYEVCRNVTPIKPMIAMAMGIPVVASDLPALREVTGGYAAYCQAENPAALAEAINQALETPSSFSAPEQWLRSRTWRSNCENLETLYRDLLRGGASA